jgi:hypothetical protein
MLANTDLPEFRAFDSSRRILENFKMIVNPNNFIPPEVMAELQAAGERAAQGVRDPEAMRQACERMDRMREEMRQKHGERSFAVDLVREVRDEE